MGDAAATNRADAPTAAATNPRPPKVSCIIIFLNPGGPFFREAIDSVVAQTHENWELFLCDDGSTDESTAIAKEYAARHPDRVRYLEHDGHANRGMSATRNLGLRHSTGAYVSFLDADDVWVRRKLEEQVEILERHPQAAIVFGPLLLWRGWTGRPDDRARDEVQGVAVPPETLVPPGQLVPLYLRDETLIPSGMMFRRDVLDAVGRYDDAFRGMYEDLVVTTKICLRWPAYASGRCWYHYRQHDQSYCTTAARQGIEDATRLRFFTWLDGYLAETRLGEPAVRGTVSEALTRLRRRPRPSGAVRLMRRVTDTAQSLGRRALSTEWREWLRDRRRRAPYTPPPGWVRMGALRRVTPVDRPSGWDRGEPIDRHYVKAFLEAHAADIRGRVLEVGDAVYTRTFGGGRVTRSDVLHPDEGNPFVTIVGDLQTGRGLPAAAFDCILLTRGLTAVDEPRTALEHVRRALAPGGVVLAAFPGIAPLCRGEVGAATDIWRLTSAGARRVFGAAFGGDANVRVQTFGNVLAAVSLLHGLGRGELKPRELAHHDPDYEVIICVRAARPAGEGA